MSTEIERRPLFTIHSIAKRYGSALYLYQLLEHQCRQLFVHRTFVIDYSPDFVFVCRAWCISLFHQDIAKFTRQHHKRLTEEEVVAIFENAHR